MTEQTVPIAQQASTAKTDHGVIAACDGEAAVEGAVAKEDPAAQLIETIPFTGGIICYGGSFAFIRAGNRTQAPSSLDHHRPGIVQESDPLFQGPMLFGPHRIDTVAVGMTDIDVVLQDAAVFLGIHLQQNHAAGGKGKGVVFYHHSPVVKQKTAYEMIW